MSSERKAALKARIKALETELDVLRRNLEEARDEARRSELRINQLRAESDELATQTREGEAARGKLDEVQSALEESRERTAKLAADITRERDVHAEVRRTATVALDRLAEVEQSWIRAASALLPLRQQNAELTLRIQTFEAQIAEGRSLKARAHELEQELIVARQCSERVQRLEQANADLLARAECAEQANRALSVQLEAAAMSLREHVERVLHRNNDSDEDLTPVEHADSDNSREDSSDEASLETYDNLLPMMSIGPSGRRIGSLVEALQGKEGHALFGPFKRLKAGRYVLHCYVAARQTLPLLARKRLCVVEALAGSTYLAQRDVFPRDMGRGAIELGFEIDQALAKEELEFRIWTSGIKPLEVARIYLKTTD